jgi:hypothetical protein
MSDCKHAGKWTYGGDAVDGYIAECRECGRWLAALDVVKLHNETVAEVIVLRAEVATLRALLREAAIGCDVQDCTAIGTWVHYDEEFHSPTFFCCDKHHDRTDEVAYDLGIRIKAALEETP